MLVATFYKHLPQFVLNTNCKPELRLIAPLLTPALSVIAQVFATIRGVREEETLLIVVRRANAESVQHNKHLLQNSAAFLISSGIL